MTCHYPNLGSASDWSCRVGNLIQPIGSTTETAHLSVTIKRLTRSKQKEVLAAMLEGKSMPSNMAANTDDTTLLKNQSAIKYLP